MKTIQSHKLKLKSNDALHTIKNMTDYYCYNTRRLASVELNDREINKERQGYEIC